MQCTFDSGTETLLSCARCGRAACPACLVDAPVGRQCPACVKGLDPHQPLTGSDLRLLARGARRSGRSQRANRRPGPVFYALVALFVGLCVSTRWLPSAATTGARVVAVGIVVVGSLLSVSLHEFGHAVVALRGGDRSVVQKGYLTLDFRRYADPLLSMGLPVLFLLMGGLPLPGGAVWIDTAALRSRWWSSAVSLAGPAMNLLFGAALVLAVRAWILDANAILAFVLLYLALIQFIVAFLNLLPIPGVDGFGVLAPHLPRGLQRLAAQVRPFGLMLLLALMFTGSLGFLFDGGYAVVDLLGLPPDLARIGAALADPRLG